ncbi:MAG: WXG100 family type VII secretion target [Lachnospiraceae bacterium]|nr:WXG100 family type VII secretion target [Lachnospiraceae bacterium]
MAGEQIKVDTKQLKTYANEIKTGYKNMTAFLAQSQQEVKNLKSTWTGTAANEFYARYEAIRSKCDEVMNIVNTYSIALSESADVYSTNEQKVTDSANKLKIKLK